jgi:hypothetical protein
MTEETETERVEPKAISLDLELSTLASATRGAQMIADLQIRHGLMDDGMEIDAAVCIYSILALVTGRFDQLRRVIRAEENPGNIWGAHNSVLIDEALSGYDVDGDIVLFPWEALRMPMVICRPSGFAAEALEKLKELKERMEREPKGRKARERKARDRVPESPSVPGEESTESPPVVPEPT